jgi:tight junction protein 1
MPPPSRQNLPPKHQRQQQQQQQQHRYDMVSVTPEPPELPVKPKKNPLKSPLKALKKAIVKGTNTLRRQASFMEPGESKKQRSLRRQHSMMERGSARQFYSQQHYPPPQDYYEYQQQQYYNYYYQQQQQQHQQQQQNQRYPIQDERYGWYQRHERYYPVNGQYDDEPLYGNYGPPPEEGLYANRALIELERSAPIQKSGGRIIRRHSMNDRRNQEVPAFATLTKRRSKYAEDIDERFEQMSIEEPIYQSKGGSYMYQEQKSRGPIDPRRQFNERPIEDNQKLLQVRKDLHSPGTSSASTPTSLSSPSKERNLRESRRQLKDQIYQSRLDAMQSMAEPNYLTRSSSGTSTNTGNLRSQPIYESKKECEEYNENEKSRNTSEEVDTSNENNEQEKSLLEVIEETILKNKSQDHLNEQNTTENEIPFADDEDVEITVTNRTGEDEKTIESEGSLQKTAIEKPLREPPQLSNIIKRAAPPPPPLRISSTTSPKAEPVYESHMSIDTQYTSQASLPVGPPNAQSTPFTSELTLKEQKMLAKAKFLATTPLRQPMTTKGYFDDQGGILEDAAWNVSLIIPPGALPKGAKQEVYFTVTDPRMSESVGGPPLDMENGWFFNFALKKKLHNSISMSCVCLCFFLFVCVCVKKSLILMHAFKF